MVPALAAAALLIPSAAGAAPAKVGNVYTETNDPGGNQIVAFDRFSDGTLAESQRVATGGVGEPAAACSMTPPFDVCPITDSQGAVNINPTGTLLFAVNAGSDTISSFRISPTRGLTLVQTINSGGDYPSSLTQDGNVLYVLNEETGNIDGFTFSSSGTMTEIPGSNQSLATPGPGGAAAQVGFDRLGRYLVVTERATSRIDTFKVTNGVAGPATSTVTPADATTPFGFAFDGLRHLVVSDALSEQTGAATTYNESLNGTLTPIDTESTNGGAPCWVVVTPDSKFAFITNTTTKSIARFALGTNGSLKLLGTTPILHTPDGPSLFPTDEALSSDGRFLYVLVPSVFGGVIGTGANTSRIDEYSVGSTGDLTFVGSTPENMGPGVSGLAAH
ncbi:MAG: lactonase family protein [Solirubrobacteraceae bacterium]